MPRSDNAQTWHILTGEYPPESGGVADYTMTVAHALAVAGECVHVWTGGDSGTAAGPVTVHRVFGRFGRRDLATAGRLLDAESGGGRLLVQWVPHAFGRGGVNLSFAAWLHRRSVSRTEPIDVMVHEPFMPVAGSLRHRGAAIVQRLMTTTVLNAASRAFAGTPAWIDFCRNLTSAPLRWIPIPSGVPVLATAHRTGQWREEQGFRSGEVLVGCFGRAGRFQETAIEHLTDSLRQGGIAASVMLVGLGSDATAARLLDRRPDLATVVRASGMLGHDALSCALRGCDVMVQPYEDGICTRHSSAAALLSHGCAIVTNAGRFTERLWRDSGAVRLVDATDVPALSAGVVRLLADEHERCRLSKAALRLYDSTFDVRHTVAALKV